MIKLCSSAILKSMFVFDQIVLRMTTDTLFTSLFLFFFLTWPECCFISNKQDRCTPLLGVKMREHGDHGAESEMGGFNIWSPKDIQNCPGAADRGQNDHSHAGAKYGGSPQLWGDAVTPVRRYAIRTTRNSTPAPQSLVGMSIRVASFNLPKLLSKRAWCNLPRSHVQEIYLKADKKKA